MPVVALFSVIGAYALDNSFFNIFYMFGFGILAFFMEEMGYPIAPLVIGIILGPMADQNVRLALTAHQGDLTPFFTRPIALVLLALIAYSLVSKTAWFQRLTKRPA